MIEMTLEEKRNAIRNFCHKKPSCTYNEKIKCPLYAYNGGCYEKYVADEVIERNFKELVKDGLINEFGNIIIDFKTGTPIKPIESPEPEEDVVNHPSHYTTGMECIDEMVLVFGEATVANFCLCNVWKYRKRALHKNGQEDLDKADWYMNKFKELVNKPIKCMGVDEYVREKTGRTNL